MSCWFALIFSSTAVGLFNIANVVIILHAIFCLFAASRAKLMTQAAVAKMRRTHVNNLYPQPEGTLGEVLSKHGKDLGYDSGFGELQKILLVLKLTW